MDYDVAFRLEKKKKRKSHEKIVILIQRIVYIFNEIIILIQQIIYIIIYLFISQTQI